MRPYAMGVTNRKLCERIVENINVTRRSVLWQDSRQLSNTTNHSPLAVPEVLAHPELVGHDKLAYSHLNILPESSVYLLRLKKAP